MNQFIVHRLKGKKPPQITRSLQISFIYLFIYLFIYFQAKLRLEMAAQHDKQIVHKDLEAKDEEMEQLRYNMQKKVNLQALHSLYGHSEFTCNYQSYRLLLMSSVMF